MTSDKVARAGFIAFLIGAFLLGFIYVFNLSRDPLTLIISAAVIMAAVLLISFYSPIE
jgi:hypothetical protein